MPVGLGVGILVGGALRSIAIDEAPAAVRGAAQGLINLCSSVGTLLSAACIGAVADFNGGGAGGFAIAYWGVAAAMLVMMFIALALRKKDAVDFPGPGCGSSAQHIEGSAQSPHPPSTQSPLPLAGEGQGEGTAMTIRMTAHDSAAARADSRGAKQLAANRAVLSSGDRVARQSARQWRRPWCSQRAARWQRSRHRASAG